MKCRDPILCYRKEGGAPQFRHFSLATPIFRIKHNQVFSCGKCIFCRKKKSAELAMRCVLHASLYKQNCFLTLTYDEKLEEYHNNFNYSDIQKFKKKLRRHCDYYYNKKIQVFNVHEYGKNGKKHWHLVVFNHDFDDKTLFTVKNGHRLYTSKELETQWSHGFNTIGDVTEASAMYQAQYTQKDFKHGNLTNGKKSHSKHSGIGRDYFLRHYDQILRLGYVPFAGRKVPIPRYFQKLAHKHYSHFNEPLNFEDTNFRKKLYSPFKDGQANRHMSELYVQYYSARQIIIEELTAEWEQELENYIFNDQKPDFVKSAENHMHDLNNKINSNQF